MKLADKDVPIGALVKIPQLDESERNNVYQVAGRDWLGYIWLSLRRDDNIPEGETAETWDREKAAKEYDGYNTNMIIGWDQEKGKWWLSQGEPRCAMEYIDAFDLEVVDA